MSLKVSMRILQPRTNIGGSPKNFQSHKNKHLSGCNGEPGQIQLNV